MWGQEVGYIFAKDGNGIIPTRVGTRPTSIIRILSPWDHPHACGDKYIKFSIDFLLAGSSPRVWGQELPRIAGRGRTGIIPTRVGTSSLGLLLPFYNKDHPHACGDKDDHTGTAAVPLGSSPRVWGQAIGSVDGDVKLGSSPRVWGQVYQKYDGNQPVRIIPTRVGTRKTTMWVTGYLQDHPHACGDKAFETVGLWKLEGSSPRVWGQVHKC